MNLRILFRNLTGQKPLENEVANLPAIEQKDYKAEPAKKEPDMAFINMINQMVQQKQETQYVQSNPEYWDRAAEKISGYYARRHFSPTGDEDVIESIEYFFSNRDVSRTFFHHHKNMASAAEILMNCKDNPTIRGWGIDIFSRSCNVDELGRILVFLEAEKDPVVQQETIAAVTNFLKFRSSTEDQKKAVHFSVKVFFDQNPLINEKIEIALKILQNELEKTVL
ncbi:MAG: hypothetical protein K9H16_00895 [Bacteroidales bacterium]|nr:hypothetical protein [Bacteroidales bacterium]